MLIIKPKSNFAFFFNDYQFNFTTHEEYLIAHDVFNLMPYNYQQMFHVKQENAYPFAFYNGENLNGKTLLIIGQLAYGDAICMTPAMKTIKKKYPDMKLWVTVSGRAKVCFEGLPYVDNILPMPVSMSIVKKADYIVKCVEMVNTPAFDNQNMVEYYLGKLRIYDEVDYTPDFPFDNKEALQSIMTQLKSNGKKVILFHPYASTIIRSIPPQSIVDLTDFNKYLPILTPPPQEFAEVQVLFKDKNVNIPVIRTNTLKEHAEIVRHSDVVVTVDTVTNHIASTVKKPTVLVGCSINPYYRSATYDNVIPVTLPYMGKTCINSCKKHNLPFTCFEAKANNTYYPPCLTSIPKSVIIQAIEDAQLIQSFKNKKETCYCGSEYTQFYEVINGCGYYECHECGIIFTKSNKNGNLHENTLVDSPKLYVEAFEKMSIKLLTDIENRLLIDSGNSNFPDEAVFLVPNWNSLYFQATPNRKYVWWDNRFYMPNAKARFTQQSLQKWLQKKYKYVKIVTTPVTYDLLFRSIPPAGIIMNNQQSIPPEASAEIMQLLCQEFISHATNCGEYLVAFCSNNPIWHNVEKLIKKASMIVNFGE